MINSIISQNNFNLFSSKLFQILILLIFLIFYQFTFSYNENIEVFFTLAHYTDLCSKNLFTCINENHELKPFFAKLFYFVIYKSTNLLTNWENKDLFILINQLIYSIFSLICFYLFSKDTKFNEKDQKIIFLFLLVVFFVISPEVFMEISHAVVPISLLSIYFFRKNSLLSFFVASLLLSFVTGMKGISISYTLMTLIFCISFYEFNKSKIIFFYICLVILHIICFYLISSDLIYAKSIQTINYNFEYFIILFLKLLPLDGYFQYILQAVSPIFGCFIFYFFIIFKNINDILKNKNFISLLTIFAVAGVVLQRGYTYHYYIYIYYFILFSLFFFNKIKLKNIYFFISALTIIIYMIFYTPLVFNKNFYGKYNFGKIHKESKLSEKNAFSYFNKILKEYDKILYLADGTPNFHLNPRSYCKEFNNLPLARFGKDIPKSRWDPDQKRNLKHKIFLENFKCTEEYSGDYVLWQKKYIDLNPLNNIKNNYTQIKAYNTKYETFVLLKKNVKK